MKLEKISTFGICLFLAIGNTSCTSTDTKNTTAINPSQTSLSRGSDMLGPNLDLIMNRAVAQEIIPGGVLLVGRGDAILHHKAYGKRANYLNEDNTIDTIYDLASLTKPIATATSIALLLQSGQIHLDDTLGTLLPEAAQNEKAKITLEEILRHRAGLPEDALLQNPQDSLENLWLQLYKTPPQSTPNKEFVYSDLGFIYLGKIVEKISGLSLAEYAEKNIFTPLEMHDTSFRPSNPTSPCDRCAPTIKKNGKWLAGVVHDPWANALGGAAGHAGLFSTAADISRYVQMLLRCGELGGAQLFQANWIHDMVAIPKLPALQWRGLGWDIDTAYSRLRGEIFPIGSFGHTGFTGTSLWIDPSSNTYIILLTNRLHPSHAIAETADFSVNDNSRVVQTLRATISTVVAASINTAPTPNALDIGKFCTVPR